MSITKIIGRSVVALTISLAPAAVATFGITGVAYAKDGNGNDGGGGRGNGNGGGRGSSASSDHGKSGDARSDKKGKADRTDRNPTLKSLFTSGKKSDKAIEAEKSVKTVNVKAAHSNTAGINSLNRNYHAYLNSNDPRMAAVSAYAIAYAEFEAENGTDVVPTNPALSDEALRDALASFTKDGVVTDYALDRAKDILGVGPEFGKIDQIRDTLPEPAPHAELDTAN
ncbi:hypothetical protein ASE23_28010 [Rhizobium sp. Root73]|uniref:hypothetical protein n=1 Tax=unclassified Rhizobium TaxID=2613769 RepID=UPI000728F4FC|nr:MULTISPECIES: hypothetical protein [unclassified Rhizobium]KQY12477.1 hypothetical protein ASD36_27960 [Rhizobium sp. Root1334]KRC04490.1 hypothetical protein ASE23_28010 [Rhizobium sp. Root73]